MSLLSQSMGECVLLVRQTTPDGYGGTDQAWVESDAFLAAITFDSSTEARVAEAAGVKSLYTVTTQKDRILNYHDVIQRISDGKVFRITSDGDDRFTPSSASLNMRQVSAEEWSIP